MPKAKIDDVELYFETEGDGDWVVLAHGGGCTHLDWWRQVYALRDRYKCLTYDARGCGQSGSGNGGADPLKINDRAGPDLLALMDQLAIDKAFLVGHSAGGLAVSWVAQNHSDRVRGLVMSDTAFGFQTAALSKWAAAMMQKLPKGFAVYDHVFAPDFGHRDPESYYLQKAMLRLNEAARPQNPVDYAKHYAEAYRRMRDAAPVDYAGFPIPTLFVVGDQDELTTPALIRDTAQAVPGARFVQIPGTGHTPQCEAPGLYNAVLMTFLDHFAKPSAAARQARDAAAH